MTQAETLAHISQLRQTLYDESNKLNVMRAGVIAAQEEMAEAECAYRNQRNKVSKLIDEISEADRQIAIARTGLG